MRAAGCGPDVWHTVTGKPYFARAMLGLRKPRTAARGLSSSARLPFKGTEHLRDMLVTSQVKDGHQAGTWNPQDQWEQSGGRLYATSLRLLMLETRERLSATIACSATKPTSKVACSRMVSEIGRAHV